MAIRISLKILVISIVVKIFSSGAFEKKGHNNREMKVELIVRKPNTRVDYGHVTGDVTQAVKAQVCSYDQNGNYSGLPFSFDCLLRELQGNLNGKAKRRMQYFDLSKDSPINYSKGILTKRIYRISLYRNRRAVVKEKTENNLAQTNSTDRLENTETLEALESRRLIGESAVSTAVADTAGAFRANKTRLDYRNDDFHSPTNSSSATSRDGELDIIYTLSEEAVAIWTKGMLSFQQFDSIRSLIRWIIIAMLIPAPPLAALSAGIFTSKRMSNQISGLIVLFNLCEGLKTTCFLINRFWKQSLGNSLITWSSPYAQYFSFFVTWGPDALGRISLMANMLVSIDRFVKLVFPLKGMTWKVIRSPKLAVTMCIIFPLVINSLNLALLLIGVRPKLDMSIYFTSDETISTIALTNPYMFEVYLKIHIFSSICFRYLPLLASISLSMTAVISVYRQQRDKRSTEPKDGLPSKRPRFSNRKRQNNTMIVVSVLLFSLLVSIKPMIRVFSTLHPTIGEGKRDLYVYVLMNEFSLFLDNSAPIVTFLSYFILGSYFRMSLRAIFNIKKAS